VAELDQQERRKIFVLVVWGLVGLLLLLFVLNNTQDTEFSIAFRTVTTPLWLLVVVVFALGVAAGWTTRWWTGRRRRR
jgi:uncharacterized integral membrane protein